MMEIRLAGRIVFRGAVDAGLCRGEGETPARRAVPNNT